MFRVAEPLIDETNLIRSKSILNDGATINEVNVVLRRKLKQNRIKRKKSIVSRGLNKVI